MGMRFFLTFGYQIQAVIIGWYVFHLTKNPLSLGLIGLCEAIPSIGIALYGGYAADKFDKKKLLQYVLLTMLVCSGVLLAITLPALHDRLGVNRILIIIYVMIFCIGIARGFLSPAVFSMMAQIVPKELYPNSSTWNSTGWQIATIGGPALGGIIYGFAGITVTFTLVLIFVLAAIVCLQFLKSRPPVLVQKESIFVSLSQGLKFVFTNRMMLGAMSLDLFSVFFGGAVALIPVIASEVLKVGEEQYGLMRSAPAVGAVLTMLVMTRHSPMGKPWRNLLFAVTGFGISIIGYGLSRNFYLTLLFLFMEGAFDSVSVIIRSTIMQLLTPDEMRGRVSSVNSMFIGSSNEIGAFESGLTAKLMGTVPAVLFGGCMTLVVVATTYFKTKRLVPLTLKEINSDE